MPYSRFTEPYLGADALRRKGYSRIAFMWKQEGRCDDVRMHRLVAHTLAFRKMLGRVLLSDIHGRFGDLDEAQSGFKKKRSTLDFDLAPDTIVKEHGRRGKSFIKPFSVSKATATRLNGHRCDRNVIRWVRMKYS